MGVFLVRHGRTEANASGLLLGRADPPLDALGRSQAAAAATRLPGGSVLVSSPLRRCRETAEILAEQMALSRGQAIADVVVDERLIELDYGELDLTPLKDVPAELWRRWRSDVEFRPAGGETLAELRSRVGECLEDHWEQASSGSVVMVTHVSPIKAGVSWALQVSIDISWRMFVAPASITSIGSGPSGPSLHLFNQTAHLEGLEANAESGI